MTQIQEVKQNSIYYTLFDNKTAMVGRTGTENNNAVDKCADVESGITIQNSVVYFNEQYSIYSINSYAFYKCKTESITLPPNIHFIGRSAFDLCGCSQTIILPEQLGGIGNWAFSENRFSTITIPKNVQSIGNGAFSYNQLKEIKVEDGNKAFIINQQVLYNSKLTILIQAPAAIENITIPQTVKIIQSGALTRTKITEIIIPASVTLIRDQFMNYCQSLKKVYILGNTNFPSNVQYFAGTTIESFHYMGILQIKNNIFEDATTPTQIYVCTGYQGTFAGIENYETSNYCQAYPLFKCKTINICRNIAFSRLLHVFILGD